MSEHVNSKTKNKFVKLHNSKLPIGQTEDGKPHKFRLMVLKVKCLNIINSLVLKALSIE